MSTSRDDPTSTTLPGEAPAGPVDRLVDEMAAAWRAGARPRADDFFGRLPGPAEEDVVRLIYEEACLREEAGEEPAAVSAEVYRRFPRYRSRLALLLDCNRLMRTPPAVEFPEVGDDLGDFRLIAEIGRGALGRTFLASQRSLAHRLVVLKVTPLGQDEHLSLARLQHMHIVPLYFEQVLPDRDLRVLGMPYLGGATLSRVLEAMASVPAPARGPGLILEALDRSSSPPPAEYPVGGPFRKFLAQKAYVTAVCWVGACLADALQYAHDRGLVHLDVKPSNVLIAGDGQPMLLDFHLAQGPVAPGGPPPDRLGGTPGYASPEQSAAMAALRAGVPPPAAVDGRSDIYSLGLLLDEALGGPAGAAGPRPRLDRRNPRVSVGLADVVAVCLAPDPADRYPTAAALAADLNRHLSDLPLLGAKNRSPVERWRKWRRREPAALARGLLRLGAAALIAGLIAFGYWRSAQRDRQTEAALAEGREHLRHRRYAEAAASLRAGLALADSSRDGDPRARRLAETLRRVRWSETADALHDLVNRLRFRVGPGSPTAAEAPPLLALCRELWGKRDQLTAPPGVPLPPDDRARVRDDLVDLATVYADLRVHHAADAGSAAARAEAVAVLLDAEARFGPGPALSRDLRAYARGLGRADVPDVDAPEPRTAAEHYDLGRSHFRGGDFARAEREFRKAVAMRPGEFWPYFSQAACAYHFRRYGEADALLTVCVALSPATAACYYNRALAREALDRPADAEADYTRALELDPGLTAASLNRGALAFRAGRPAEAAADFRRALGPAPAGRPDAVGDALDALARGDWPAARDLLRRVSRLGDPSARSLLAKLGAG